MLGRFVGFVVGASALAVIPARAENLAAAAPSGSSVPPSTASDLNIPIEKIARAPGGCAVLDKDFPGLLAHPMYEFFKVMSLSQIAAMSHGKITPEMLAQAQTDLSVVLPTQVAGDPVPSGNSASSISVPQVLDPIDGPAMSATPASLQTPQASAHP